MIALLDTNIVLYLLGGRLLAPLPIGLYGVSVITEMELLSYPQLTPADESAVREFVADVTIVELTPAIRKIAVQLRREHRLKLPDAIVAASALDTNTELLTNDTKLTTTPGLRAKALPLR